MLIVTEDATLVCDHQAGIVSIKPSQSLVTIEGKRVLVESDPENRTIAGCPNVGPGIKACSQTLRVQKGYSDLLSVQGHRICLDTVKGLTDGTPPGSVHYTVRHPGQNLAGEI
jgi:hypothetical protein